ncbi:substrate-binding domain-containing protein [Williamsia serinedens]|uniref:Amino acid/amide ABC transporter substrate-binding protein, HAAT family (TC 3.A.1.4.-) n=1 Tax=Williamsia serinedens TaxID=391736 RepID=A0ABT1H0J0_9NOCA|nr:substrate-binding domain-containing protein [Williamsia serinedens]MCP2160761.1 amino acid/amide ABC transporter substrate-binding protein, HAAT family (TC 3.A.1.4.-) [Williamsia serinedens]
MRVGVVIPQSGPSGIFGPSCAAAVQVAVDELNEADGLLGEPIAVTVVDGGASPEVVARKVTALCRDGAVDALVGWHNSSVRKAVVAARTPSVPYVYTATYEGGESTEGVFLTGETPDCHVLPAMGWLGEQLGVRRWAVVGSDYIWPRRTEARVRRAARRSRVLEVASTTFVPLGTSRFGPVLDAVDRAEVDGVLVLLLGSDAVAFNRAFARRGLADRCVRLGPLMDENMLLASGAGATRGLYSTAGFFENLASPDGLELSGRYFGRLGTSAPPLTSPGESCYEGIRLLVELARRAGCLNGLAINRVAAEGFRYVSPRGDVVFDGRHLAQDVYVAAADALEFDVMAQVSAVA